MMRDPADSPMQAFDDSPTWLETGPEPILADTPRAALMVRVGMASNALLAQREMTQATGGQSANVGRARDTVWLLTSTAATTREAVMLAKDNLTQLQELALQGEASEELLDAISQLCDGEHPAADILRRARNKVGT